MGKIGQSLGFIVESRHETLVSRWVVVRYDAESTRPLAAEEPKALTVDAAVRFRLYIPAGAEMPLIGQGVRFVGGIGLDGCLTKVEREEPIFVLLGRDPQAPGAIRDWVAERLRARGVQVPMAASTETLGDLASVQDDATSAKLNEALQQAAAMTAWAAQTQPS